jgi:alkylation response protein AidB-like acyl-CoA dehydrogenase
VQIAINGPAFVLSTFGTERLRRSYVPPVIAGRSLISIAITEEDAGSALGETATRVTDKGDVVVVDGTKCFVTGGGLSSAHLVMARFGGEGMRGLGYVLVPADAEGCRVVRTYEKLGGNAVPEAVVELRGCAVPADHVIIPGDPGSTGGFRRAMTTYNAMRLGIAAICCGVATRALCLAVRHLRTRQQSGRPLASYQGLRWRTAEIAAGHAIQMLGWRGIVRDADHPAERLLREIRGWTIAGGTNEALLNLLAGELLDR